MYNIVFTKKGDKDFNSLNDELKNRVVHVLERISIDPYRYMRKLKDQNSSRIRVGDYRILVEIDEKKKNIIILGIGHRKNIYDW